jgi:hypothetical protein
LNIATDYIQETFKNHEAKWKNKIFFLDKEAYGRRGKSLIYGQKQLTSIWSLRVKNKLRLLQKK